MPATLRRKARAPDAGAATAAHRLLHRFLNRRGSALFTKNAIASIAAFAVDLAMLWALVERFGMRQLPAAAIGFIAANSLHYVLARIWVFRGSDRGVLSGYVIFLLNGCIGLIVILGLFWLLSGPAGIPYLIARVAASLAGGTIVFVLNATGNFHQL